MKNLLFRLGVGLAVSAGAVVAYLISPDLANALSVGIGIALLGLAFVVTPLVLERGMRTKLWVILLALSLVLGLVGNAISGFPAMVMAFALASLAFAVFMVRSVAFTSSRRR